MFAFWNICRTLFSCNARFNLFNYLIILIILIMLKFSNLANDEKYFTSF